MHEPRIGEGRERLGDDARPALVVDQEGGEQHRGDRLRHAIGDGSLIPRRRSRLVFAPSGDRHNASRAGLIPSHEQQPVTDVLEPIREQPRDQVGRLVVGRQRPEMGLTPDGREQDAHLGQPPIEGDRVVRPSDGLDAVPERLDLDRIMEEDRVAQVAQLPAGNGVDLGLVPQESPHEGGVHARIDHARASETVFAPWAYRCMSLRLRPRTRKHEESQMSRTLSLAVAAALLLIVSACSSGTATSSAPSVAAPSSCAGQRSRPE